VLVTTKLRILERRQAAVGERVTTVSPRQGHMPRIPSRSSSIPVQMTLEAWGASELDLGKAAGVACAVSSSTDSRSSTRRNRATTAGSLLRRSRRPAGGKNPGKPADVGGSDGHRGDGPHLRLARPLCTKTRPRRAKDDALSIQGKDYATSNAARQSQPELNKPGLRPRKVDGQNRIGSQYWFSTSTTTIR